MSNQIIVAGQVVRQGQYVLRDARGVNYKVVDRVTGTCGAIVLRMIDGKLVRQFGL